eukprot:757919-Hanusia_phi.AAC.8
MFSLSRIENAHLAVRGCAQHLQGGGDDKDNQICRFSRAFAETVFCMILGPIHHHVAGASVAEGTVARDKIEEY